MTAPVGGCAGTSQLARQHFRFGTSLLERHAMLQACSDLHSDNPRSEISVFDVGLQHKRGEHIDFFVVRTQGPWQDTYDGDGAPIDGDLSSYNVRIAVKPVAPAVIREDHDRVMAGDLFFIEKIAAENRLDAQGGQPVRGNQQAGEILPRGLISAIEKIGPTSAGDLLEGRTVLLQGQKLWWRRSVRLAALVCGPDVDQLLRLPKWQHAQ